MSDKDSKQDIDIAMLQASQMAINKLFDKMDGKVDSIQNDLNSIKVSVAKLETSLSSYVSTHDGRHSRASKQMWGAIGVISALLGTLITVSVGHVFALALFPQLSVFTFSFIFIVFGMAINTDKVSRLMAKGLGWFMSTNFGRKLLLKLLKR